jgi:hypothetical protein
LAGFKPNQPIPSVPRPEDKLISVEKSSVDQLGVIKASLCGKWVDQSGQQLMWVTMGETDALQVVNEQGEETATIDVSKDVYSCPIPVSYLSKAGAKFHMEYQPGTDKYATWFAEGTDENWMMRRPADAIAEFPKWAEFLLIEIAGSADPESKTMGVAAMICAVSNVPTSGKVHGEQYWMGHMSFCGKDFGEENHTHEVNVPLATCAAVAFGLRALLDLKQKVGGSNIKGVFISSDHTVIESVMAKEASQNFGGYLEPIVTVLNAYKQEVLDDEAFPEVLDFKVSKIAASANKASKLAKEARMSANDPEFPACSMGDIELYDAVIEACEQVAKK